MSLYIFYRQSNQLDEADSEQLVADTINQRVAKLEDEMEQNLRVPPTLIFFRVMNIFGSVMVQNGHQQNLRVIT